MRRFSLVMVHEYLSHVLRRRFLLALLGPPLAALLFIILLIVIALLQLDSRPVGFVDLSGQFKTAPGQALDNEPRYQFDNEFQLFADESTAMRALQAGSIKAFYVIQPDYLQSGKIHLVALDAPSEDVQIQFEKLLRSSLLAGQPKLVAERIINGYTTVVISLDGKRSMSPSQWMDIGLPLIVAILFVVAVNTSGGYLLDALIDEWENRTLEIIVTSVSTDQLMIGKIVGNLGAGLTQLSVWALMGLCLFRLVQQEIPVQNLQVNPLFIWAMLLTLIPAFVLVSALMAIIGATATEPREAQIISGIFSLPIFAPFWFITNIMGDPNGRIATFFSIFPLSAPVTLPLRAVFSDPPLWQIGLAFALLLVCATLAVWMAGRAFRHSLLSTGKRFSLKALFHRREFAR